MLSRPELCKLNCITHEEWLAIQSILLSDMEASTPYADAAKMPPYNDALRLISSRSTVPPVINPEAEMDIPSVTF